MNEAEYIVYNPDDIAIDDLPIIYGFNNGGEENFLQAQLVAQDGTVLGNHCCSGEWWMEHDLQINREGDRHEEDFKPHYSHGYRMEFVSRGETRSHSKLMTALSVNFIVPKRSK